MDWETILELITWIKTEMRYNLIRTYMFNNAPHQRRAPYCDFLEVIKFLKLFRKGPRNAYQIYRSIPDFGPKKTYRYLRYCRDLKLLEVNHVRKYRIQPTIYYRLTQKGRAIIELFKSDRIKRQTGKGRLRACP